MGLGEVVWIFPVSKKLGTGGVSHRIWVEAPLVYKFLKG